MFDFFLIIFLAHNAIIENKLENLDFRYSEIFYNFQNKMSELLKENENLNKRINELENINNENIKNNNISSSVKINEDNVSLAEFQKQKVIIKEQFVELDVWKIKYKEREKRLNELGKLESEKNYYAEKNINLEQEIILKNREISLMNDKIKEINEQRIKLIDENEQLSKVTEDKKRMTDSYVINNNNLLYFVKDFSIFNIIP